MTTPLTRHWTLLGALALCGFVGVRHLQTLGSTIYNEWFERDVARAAGLLEGRWIFVGPELWAGGHIPGPFLYFWNLPALALYDHPIAVIVFTYAQFAVAGVALFLLGRKYFGAVAGFWATALLVTNSGLFLSLKMAWNPTEAFLLYVVWLWLLFRATSAGAGLGWCAAAGLLLGLLCQIHLSFLVHGLSLIVGLIWLRPDMRWRAAAVAAICVVAPLMPYFIYKTWFSHGFVEPLTARAYRSVGSYFEGVHPASLLEILKLAIFRITAFPREIGLWWVVWPDAPAVAHVAASAVTLAARIAGAAAMAGCGFVLIGRLVRRRAVASTERVLLLALLAPVVAFYPYLNLAQMPIHYLYVLLVPLCLFAGLAVARANAWLAALPGALRHARFPYAAILAGYLSIAVVAVALPAAPRLVPFFSSTNQLTLDQARALARALVELADLPPDALQDRLSLSRERHYAISLASRFPVLYAAEHRLRLHTPRTAAGQPLPADAGLVLGRGQGAVEATLGSAAVSLLWDLPVAGAEPVHIAAYRMAPTENLRHGPMTNWRNPYLLDDADERLLRRFGAGTAPPMVARSPDGRRIDVELLIDAVRLPLRLEIEGPMRAADGSAWLRTRLHSPFLTGFSGESGQAKSVTRAGISVRLGSGRELTCPLYPSVGSPILGSEFVSQFNAPFEVNCRLPDDSPVVAARFEADDAQDIRSGRTAGAISVALF